jgi:hypothetical protein
MDNPFRESKYPGRLGSEMGRDAPPTWLGILLNSHAQQFNLLCKRLLTLQAVVSINLNGLF